LQDRLVKLCFQGLCVVDRGVERSQERPSARQVAIRLCNCRLCCNGVNVAWCDIENLIELPQRFGETTKTGQGQRMLAAYENVARVEPLSFVEVPVAPVPLASPARDISQ